MASIQQLVLEGLDANPLLSEMLHQGLANVSAVADHLKKPLEAKLGRRLKRSAISMAVRRAVESAPKVGKLGWRFPSNLEVSTKSNIYEVAIERTARAHDIIGTVSKKAGRGKGDFLSVIEGTYEVAFFTNQKNKPALKKLLASQHISSERDNLSYVSVNWDKSTKDIPGIYYRVTRALAFRGISIQSFHTIGAEMMLFFAESDFFLAYETMNGMLRSSR